MNAINENDSTVSAYQMSRPRIDKILDNCKDCKLIYVVAGAGYGKTQAVRSYVEKQQDAIVRWIQLTEGDNIGSRYWESFTHVISIDNPEMAMRLRELGFPETLTRFKQYAEITRTMEHQSHKTFLVLDDFHLIHSAEALAFAERCAHMRVQNTCVIIISRKEPDMNVASLLFKGKVSFITEEELRFTTEEAMDLFQRCAIPVSAQELSPLIEATKGWALAINMLSIILKKMPSNLKYALNVMVQNIFKFFEIEAWKDLPQEVQKTLVKLSLQSDLPLVPPQKNIDEMKFLQDTPELMSFMWTDNLTGSFRIHPLYVEFLQTKHDILSDEETQEVYKWVAEWCAENDFYMNAIHYYAKSGQFEQMIRAFFACPLRLPRDASEYFLNILGELGTGETEQDKYNILFLKHFFTPVMLAGAGKYEEAKKWSLDVVEQWESQDNPLATVLTYISYSNLAYIDMYMCTFTHEYNSPMYLRKSLEYSKRSSHQRAELSETFISADVRSFACLVGEGAAISELDEFLEAAKQVELMIAETTHNVYAGYADLVECEYAFFKNQPNDARKHAHNAILRAREMKQYGIAAMAEEYLLHIAMQEGNRSLVKEILRQMRTYLDNPNFWSRQLYYDLYTGAFYAQIGLPERVPHWLIMDEKETASGIHIPERELIVTVSYYIASKKYHQALEVLRNSYPREPHERFLFGEIRLALLTAVARIKTDDTVGAMADFEKAYHMSFDGMFEMFFIELGKELHTLVAAALKMGECSIPEKWLREIDRKASIYAKKCTVVADAFGVKESPGEIIALTDREKEILADLYHGLSRDEIAENRYLSINTVKKALRSIYLKLDAKNNIDAVRIAVEKKII